MKKKIVVFVAVLVLILSSAGTVFAADVFSDGGAESDASGEFQDEMASGTQQGLSEGQLEYAVTDVAVCATDSGTAGGTTEEYSVSD